MEPVAPGVHPVDLFAREYDIRSACLGVLELRALVCSGTVGITTRAMLGVQLDPVVTIEAELLGFRVSLVPLIRTTKCTYRVTIVQRRFIGIGVHFGCHLECWPKGRGSRDGLRLISSHQGAYGVCAHRRPAPCWHAAAFFRQAGGAGGLATVTEPCKTVSP